MTESQRKAMQDAIYAMDADDPKQKAAISALFDALAQPAPVQEPVCRGCGIPINDIHMSTCPTKKWPMYVTPADAAQPAPVQEKP